MQDWIAELNPVDWTLLVVGVVWTMKGLVRGLSKELAGLCILLLALLTAVLTYRPVGAWLTEATRLDETPSTVLAFIALFVTAALLGKLISLFLSLFFDVDFSPFVERSGGLAMGALKSVFAASLLFRIVGFSDHEYLQRVFIEESWFGRQANTVVPALYDKLASVSDPWMPAITAEAGTDPIEAESVTPPPSKLIPDEVPEPEPLPTEQAQ